jgi:hypothetical protein
MVAGSFGDGHVDLIVADRGSSPLDPGQGLEVFQVDEGGALNLQGTLSAGPGPSAIVAGDWNGDGTLDLAVTDQYSDQVSVLLNEGDGTFRSPVSYSVGQNPFGLLTGDFGNGHADLAIANQNSGDVSILMGNGDGTFQPQLRFQGGAAPNAIVSADWNGDGRTDLAVANKVANDIVVLLGRGDGTFQDQSTNSVGESPSALITADLNHDGHEDVVSTDFASNEVSVLIGNGDGTFQVARSFPAGIRPTAIVAGDWNGDGRLDLAVTDAGDPITGAGAGVSILLGNGDGTFQEPPMFHPAGVYPTAIAAGDFTGNGILDLAIANLFPEVDNPEVYDVTILLGDGHGGFPTSIDVPLSGNAVQPVSIVAADFTGAGGLDIAVGEQVSDSVSLIEGDGHGGFRALSPIPLNNDYSMLESLLVSDINGDGSPDLAALGVSPYGSNELSVLLGKGNGAFNVLPIMEVAPGLSATSMAAGHFFGTTSFDLAVTDRYSGSVALIQGDGHGEFSGETTLNVQNAYSLSEVTIGDFTGDGLSDLAVATQYPNTVAIELNQKNGQFAPPGSVGLSAHNTPVVADFSGDGATDAAIVDGSGSILFREGEANQPGTFHSPVTINPGLPSRDIAAVSTGQGTLLASVDARDNGVSLYQYLDGSFSLVGSLPTGPEPAQIVSSDLNESGQDDLIIRNAGDGSLTVYMSNGHGRFLSPMTLAGGSGISDVSVADVNQDGLLDILLANQTAGEVEVILNQGAAGFSPPTLYRAGVGLYEESGGAGTAPLSLSSDEATGGVAASLIPGGPPDLLALNAGSETIGILDGLGGGRFANPISVPTSGAALAIRVADFTGSGIPDLAILGQNGLSIWLGDGKGGFSSIDNYDVGPDPSGLTVANLNGDKLPDLVVGNAFGDVLVLLGEGNGAFQTPVIADQSIGLAVAYTAGNSTPTIVLVEQAHDLIAVQNGPNSQPLVLANRSSGLILPGAPVLADLNGDGIPDLIVPNTGGNNVLVYPGLPGGGFGQALNDGNGFSTGTNPVAVVAADLNGDGRPDLLVADEGSNDISILLNEPQGNGFTFTQGPRLSAGSGPVALLYGDFSGNGVPDILVSDSGSNSLRLIPGQGDGFFNDGNPTIIELSQTPGPILAGPFEGGTAPDIVALNPGSDGLTLVSGLSTSSPSTQAFSFGGFDPVEAFAVLGSSGFEDLIVTSADGRVELLKGSRDGLLPDEFNNSLAGLNPNALALASIHHDDVEFYAVFEGQESASLFDFSLQGSSPLGESGLALFPLQEQSLPLIATFLGTNVDLSATEVEPSETQGMTAALVALSTSTTAVSLGQGPDRKAVDHSPGGNEGALFFENEFGFPTASDSPSWKRDMMGLEEAFDEFRRAIQPTPPSGEQYPPNQETQPPAPKQPTQRHGAQTQVRETFSLNMIDAAIESIAEQARTSSWLGAPERNSFPGTTKVAIESLALPWLVLAVPSTGCLVGPAPRTRSCRLARARRAGR